MAELVCGTQDREAWLAARRQGITATDLPVILGLVTWDSPFALYWRKKGKLPEVEQSDRMRLGSWLEQSIAAEWLSRNHGWYDPEEVNCLWRSSSRPWQLSTLDRALWHSGSSQLDPDSVLECKTSATRDGWGHGIGGHGECGTLTCEENSKVPESVRAQVLWQMDTLNVPTGHVAVVFLPSGEFRSYTISHALINGKPHENLIAGLFADCATCKDILLMREKAVEFYERLLDDDPPPVDGLQVTTDALRHLHAGAVKGKQAEVSADLYLNYTGACRNAKEAAEWKHEVENTLRAQMGDATLAAFNEQVFARREVFKRAGYTVAPCEVDRLVRVKPREDEHDG